MPFSKETFGVHLNCFLIFDISAFKKSGSPGLLGICIFFPFNNFVKYKILCGFPVPTLYISFFLFEKADFSNISATSLT